MKRLFLLVLLLITCSPLTKAQEPSSQHKPITIVDSLIAAGNFKTLLAALNESGLTETLKEKGPFTIFAPRDEAFAKLSPETLKALMNDPVKLKSLLLYHVTDGTISLKDLRGQTGKSITMLGGSKVTIQDNSFGPAQVVINKSAKVIAGDISASNGMIHVIDTVLSRDDVQP